MTAKLAKIFSYSDRINVFEVQVLVNAICYSFVWQFEAGLTIKLTNVQVVLGVSGNSSACWVKTAYMSDRQHEAIKSISFPHGWDASPSQGFPQH